MYLVINCKEIAGMSNDKEKAKKIFFDYACNHFYMERDGVGKEYENFGVSEAEEKEWRREYISFWVSQLSIDDLTAVDKLYYAWAVEAVPALIKMADKGDSYAKLWYANALWHISDSSRISVTMREDARRTAINLWQTIVQQPVELSENHRAKIISYKSSSSPEKYVLNYAKSNLENAKERGNSFRL